jgi:formylmethanofuran dehydrogenase subunit E
MSTDDTQFVLFDVTPPAVPKDRAAAKPGVVECSECGRLLRSEKSVVAGVGPGCAA